MVFGLFLRSFSLELGVLRACVGSCVACECGRRQGRALVHYRTCYAANMPLDMIYSSLRSVSRVYACSPLKVYMHL